MQRLNYFWMHFIWLFVLIFWGYNFAYSQTNTYAFKTLTTDQGLIHNHINCSMRDRYNYLWFGTESGLSRFDGVQFTNFRYSSHQGTGLSNNVISGIFEGPLGNVWIRTGAKMNVYDQQSGRIVQNMDSILANMNLPIKEVDMIRGLDADTFALLYSDRTLVVFDAVRKKYKEVLSEPGHRICDFVFGKNADLWIIYEDGLLNLLNLKTLESVSKLRLPLSEKQIKYNLFEDQDGDIWVFSKETPIGAYWLDRSQWKITHLLTELSNPFVGNIVQDDHNHIWLGTDHGGINVFHKTEKTIQIIGNDRYDLRSLPYNSITSLYKDKSGIIWVGTYKGGISYYHPHLLLFPLFRNYLGLPKSLPFDDVNKFVQDRKGNLWIGTNGGGLLYYDIMNNTYRQYLHEPSNPHSLSSNVIVSLFLDKDDKLWIGTYRSGMCRFDGKAFKTFHKGNGKDELNDDSVWEIFEDSSNRLWVGTLGSGLYRFDKQKEVFSKVVNPQGESINGTYIAVLFEDSKKQLWIGSATGLAIISREGKITYLNVNNTGGRLRNDLIYDIKEDSKGRIWVATQEGVHIIEGKEIKCLTRQDGLIDDAMLTLLVDNKGNIWGSSNKGLSEIAQSAHADKFIIRNFTKDLGLQSNVFNENAALKMLDGRLVFGGPKGFNFIDPEKILGSKNQPLPVLSNIYLFNKRIAVGELFSGRVIYDQALASLKVLELPYHLNAISLELSTFDYLQQDDRIYQYQLQESSNEWFDFEPGTMRASFTNLDAKSYHLYIRHSLDSKSWSDKMLLLTIAIQPPLWLSAWAFILYAVLLVMGLWGCYYWVKLRIKTRNQLILANEQAMQAKELDALKTRFFTNISHEFRTPISLIMTPTQQLLDQEDDEGKKSDLSLIKKNADRLLKLVNQLLDFRKLENRQLVLNAEYGDIIIFIQEQLDGFVDFAQNNQVNLTIHLPSRPFFVWFDKNKLESIIFNLTSNAIKFSPVSGTVSIDVRIEEGLPHRLLCIEVGNTGNPIPEVLQARLFERYFQHEVHNGKLNQGTGIGLSIVKDYVDFLEGKIEVTSDPKWTRFYIRLPLHEDQKIIDIPKDKASGQQRILLIEDNLDFLHYLEKSLKPDYMILGTSTVTDAKALIGKYAVNLVIADLNLPGESGIDFCRYLKSHPKFSHIPVLIVTAVTNQEIEVEALQAGAADYITKPFNIKLLQSKLTQIFNQQQNLVKRYQKQIKVDLVQPEVASADEQFIYALVQEIERDLSDSALSVELLAKRMHLTRVGLYKKVLAITGYSPMEYIRHIRLKRAMHLVQNSKLSIAEIAYEVGFSNPKHFSKYFKSAFGNLPSFYRKNH